MSLIRAENLSKTIITPSQTLKILEKVNLTIAQRESLAITGISGSGKTTLLSMLAGIELPSSGQVFYQEKSLTELPEEARAKLRLKEIGFIFQNFQLIPSLSALENIMLPAELLGRSSTMIDARNLLEKIGLSNRANHYPLQLSGGEQQRVAIARAFCNRPTVLFADEPTANLDQKTARQIIDLIFELVQASHTTLVCVTHDPALSEQCQRTVKLDQGKLFE